MLGLVQSHTTNRSSQLSLWPLSSWHTYLYPGIWETGACPSSEPLIFVFLCRNEVANSCHTSYPWDMEIILPVVTHPSILLRHHTSHEQKKSKDCYYLQNPYTCWEAAAWLDILSAEKPNPKECSSTSLDVKAPASHTQQDAGRKGTLGLAKLWKTKPFQEEIGSDNMHLSDCTNNYQNLVVSESRNESVPCWGWMWHLCVID